VCQYTGSLRVNVRFATNISVKRDSKTKGSDIPEAVRAYFSEIGRKAWKGVSAKGKKARASHAARSRWESMTPEERSAEMKRRAAVRKRKAKFKDTASISRRSGGGR
jgi:hypothetical protein